VSLVEKLVQKEERDSYIQKEKQYTKHYKTLNTKQKTNTRNRKNKHKRMLKNINRGTGK
jgi:Skp family chaperone for outer membrane proteins